MALRNIVTEKEARLRKVSRPVEKFDERLWTLLDDMADTMYEADGVGIAGVQVGVLRRVFVVDNGVHQSHHYRPKRRAGRPGGVSFFPRRVRPGGAPGEGDH